MRKVGVAAAFVLVLAGVLGGLVATGVFGGGGSSNSAAAAATQTQEDVLSSENQNGTNGKNVYLGLQLTQTGDGPTVAAVISGSPADKAGLQRGDVITAVDGTAVSNVQGIRDALANKQAGDTATLSIKRNGNAQDVKVTLETPPAPLAGVNSLLPELSGIPANQLFSHLMGGSFQFTDANNKSHTATIELGTVASVDTNAKTVSVNLNAGGSNTYTVSNGVTALPSDLTKFQSGDHVIAVSIDGNLRLIARSPGTGLFGGLRGFGGGHGLGRGGWNGLKGEGNSDMPSTPAMPSGAGVGGF